MDLGSRIKFFRTNKNISQEELAEKIAVSRQAVSKWETNKAAPSTQNLIQLSSVLEVKIEELTQDSLEQKDPKCDELGFRIGYSWSAMSAMFFYSIQNLDTTLKTAYAILGFVGVMVLYVFTYRLYGTKTRTRINFYNLIFLLLTNTLGLMSKFYGGIIAMILIVILALNYEKILKKLT